jgi:hypothetical protein
MPNWREELEELAPYQPRQETEGDKGSFGGFVRNGTPKTDACESLPGKEEVSFGGFGGSACRV